jgi:PAS domain S-box-containing protein
MTERDMTTLAESVLDQIADAVIYADREGKIRRWNRAAVALFGYLAAEALGSSIDIIVPERLREPHWRGFDAAMASGSLKLSGRPTLTRAHHKDGSRLYIEMSFALVKEPGSDRPIGSVAVARLAPPRAPERVAVAATSSC